MVGFFLIMFIIFALALDPPENPNVFGIVLFVTGTVLAGGGIAFAISGIYSHYQQKHIRLMAAEAKKAGLQFIPSVRVPAELGDAAFPVICPTPPDSTFEKESARSVVDLLAVGVIDGQELLVVEYAHHFDPNDHMPFGAALKTIQTIVKPSTFGDRPQIWQSYLLTYYLDELIRVPDFVVTPNVSGYQKTHLERTFPGRLSPIDAGGSNNYLLAVAGTQRHLFGREFRDLLASTPNWSIQVVAGRLIVWNGPKSTNPSQPVSQVVAFAAKLRRLLTQSIDP